MKRIKNILNYLPWVVVLGFLGLMHFTSYDKVDKLPILRGEGIQWDDLTFQEALLKAENENKPIFIDFYATWCKPCKMLKSVTFPRESVGETFNKNFINLTVDVDTPDGRKLANKYQVRSYPTLIIMDNKGIELGRKKSFVIPMQLNSWAEEFSQHASL